MGGGLPGGAQAGGLLPCPYFSLLQFRVIAVDAVLAGQAVQRQIQRESEPGPELLGKVGNQDGPGKESRKLRAGVVKIKIYFTDAEEWNRKVERASVHRAGNQSLDALHTLVH